MAPAGLFLVLVLAGAGPGSEPGAATVLDERFGSRTAPILLLVRPDVQLEVHLDAKQVADAKSEIARLVERALSLKDKKGDAVLQERWRIDQEMVRWLTTSLSETQFERLLQVNLQWEGAAALTRPHVLSHLKITKDQRLSIDQLLAQVEATRRARGLVTPGEVGRVTAQALAVLTPDQKAHWIDLLGPPCRFSIIGQAVTTQRPVDPRVVKSRTRSDQ